MGRPRKSTVTPIKRLEPITPPEEEPMETTTAKVTNSKFIGGKWYYLYMGEKFTAPRSLIRKFRKAGFVF